MNTTRKIADAELPDGWRMVRLGDVAQVDTGGTPSREVGEYWSGEIPWMASSEVNQKRVQATAETITEKGMASSNAKIFPPGTIMVAMNGQGSTRGKASILEIEAACNQSLAAVRSKGETTNPFLFHVLSAAYDRLRGITGEGRNGLNLELIRGYRLCLPPLPEQRAIADVLDSIDEAIERTEAVIAATETLRDSLLHELLTRGVPGWHTEWKDVPGIGAIPADWEVVRLDRVATVERGKFAHRPRNEPRFYGGDIPFIQTSDVVRSVGVIKSHSQTLNELGLSISRLFPAGTVVITIAANIGETAITGYPVAFPDSLVGITPTDVDGRFLEYYLRTQKATLERFAPESAQKNINLEDLRPMLVPFPSMSEQTTIAEQLDAVQADVDSLRALLADTRGLKDSAAEELLSGRVYCAQEIGKP